MKKLLIIMFMLIVAVSSFAACGKTDGPGEETGGKKDPPSVNKVQPITNGGSYEFD